MVPTRMRCWICWNLPVPWTSVDSRSSWSRSCRRRWMPAWRRWSRRRPSTPSSSYSTSHDKVAATVKKTFFLSWTNSTSKVAQVVKRRTTDMSDPGSNPTGIYRFQFLFVFPFRSRAKSAILAKSKYKLKNIDA